MDTELLHFFQIVAPNAKPFYQTPELWTVIGVALGFGLSEITRILRDRAKKKLMRLAIHGELEAIKFQIYQKRENVRQVIQELQQGKILSGITLPTPHTAYNKYYPEIYGELSLLERNCLHTIYEHLLLNDKLMFDFENELKKDLIEKISKDPVKHHLANLRDIGISYDAALKWIDSYLTGNPIDVLHVEKISKNPEAEFNWVNLGSEQKPESNKDPVIEEKAA
jgi:hypothetical protein